jgi:hypothetical protein
MLFKMELENFVVHRSQSLLLNKNVTFFLFFIFVIWSDAGDVTFNIQFLLFF